MCVFARNPPQEIGAGSFVFALQNTTDMVQYGYMQKPILTTGQTGYQSEFPNGTMPLIWASEDLQEIVYVDGGLNKELVPTVTVSLSPMLESQNYSQEFPTPQEAILAAHLLIKAKMFAHEQLLGLGFKEE